MWNLFEVKKLTPPNDLTNTVSLVSWGATGAGATGCHQYMKKKTFDQLSQEILLFNKARGWDPEPVDLAKSIMIEGAELLEHFQWDESSMNREYSKTKDWEEIGFEAADVLRYIIIFCNKSGIDILDALDKKLAKTELKYPLEMFNGVHNEDLYKQQKKKYRETTLKK